MVAKLTSTVCWSVRPWKTVLVPERTLKRSNAVAIAGDGRSQKALLGVSFRRLEMDALVRPAPLSMQVINRHLKTAQNRKPWLAVQCYEAG